MSNATSPVADYTVRLQVLRDGSVSVRVTRESHDKTVDPKHIEDALGLAMENLGEYLAQDIDELKRQWLVRPRRRA